MELENKLAAYRARKKREEQMEVLKNKVKNFFIKKEKVNSTSEQDELLIDETPCQEPENVINTEKKSFEMLTIFIYSSGLILWCYLYYIFINLQFGIIYLLVSALFGIYFNTRTGPKDKDEISAYSVFNKNCKSIDGTLKAEQFEREIRFGAQSVH